MFGIKRPVSTDKTLINELLTRGVSALYPSREFLEQKLLSGERLTVYLGIDPTGKTLHVGHTITVLKLSEFQKLGHRVILLIGDFTAMIGDPTDKTVARASLSRDEVLENAKCYKRQLSHLLDFNGPNPAGLKYNSQWLAPMTLTDTAKLFSMITYAQTIKRDMFQKRIEENKDLFLHEFMYPVLQGYDSVAMDVDGEIGGNDQVFNMLVGRDLLKKMKNKEKFVVATKLLTDAAGKKMGKTEGNMVALDEDAEQIFGKVMSWDDAAIIPGLELCTKVPLIEIAELVIQLREGMNPRDAKLRLAKEIVTLYHGAAAAQKAAENFESTFSNVVFPVDAPVQKVKKESMLADALTSIIASKSEFTRLIAEGAVFDFKTGQKITDRKTVVSADMDLRIGKHRFVRIKINP